MAVLTLAELKRHLGSKASDDEADLTALIDAAQSAVAARCGPLEPTSVTTRIAGCGATQIALPRRPLISVTSVTGRAGVAMAAASYWVDYDTAVVYTSSEFSEDYYDVVYSVGRASCPAHLKEAVKEMARHMWVARRGPSSGVAGSESINALRRAEEFMFGEELGAVG